MKWLVILIKKKIMEGLKKLYNWLCDKVEDQDICVEERVTYSKVLDYIERNISTKEYI